MGTETAIHGNHVSVKTQDGKTVVVMLCAGNYCCFKAQARFIKPASIHGSERPIILSSAHLLKYSPLSTEVDVSSPPRKFHKKEPLWRARRLSVNAFNVGDRLYRNHLSFIKELRRKSVVAFGSITH
jgi:hypothetical protein